MDVGDIFLAGLPSLIECSWEKNEGDLDDLGEDGGELEAGTLKGGIKGDAGGERHERSSSKSENPPKDGIGIALPPVVAATSALYKIVT